MEKVHYFIRDLETFISRKTLKEVQLMSPNVRSSFIDVRHFAVAEKLKRFVRAFM